MNKTNAIDGILITIGSAFGLAEIESLMGIIILCLQALWIIIKLIIYVYSKYADDGKISKEDIIDIVNKAEETTDELKKVKENVDK